MMENQPEESDMSGLQIAFQQLVDRGLVVPSPDAPSFEPLYVTPSQQSKIVYNIGEAMIQEEVTRAKLGASTSRNPSDRRQAQEPGGWID